MNVKDESYLEKFEMKWKKKRKGFKLQFIYELWLWISFLGPFFLQRVKQEVLLRLSFHYLILLFHLHHCPLIFLKKRNVNVE